MISLRLLTGLVLVWSYCHNHHAHSLARDQLALNLFDNGRDEAVFFIPVGSGEHFHRQLASNNQTDQLVMGSVRSIEVTLNGGCDTQDSERIIVNKDTAAVTITIIGHLYRYVLSGSPSATEYSTLLSSLTYVSNLSSEALNDSQRNITISAYDNNNSSVTAVAILTLIPANLAAPTFPSNPIQAQVRENTETGGLVTTINAYDPEGHQVTFSFRELSPTFSISTSGEVRVLDSVALDYENVANRVFYLLVTATDNDPVSPQSSNATLIVYLINVNDNSPIFSHPNYTFSVVEEAAGAVVGTVQATDADDINSLRFDFQSAITALTFTLNHLTGELSVRSALNYEIRTSYTFQVTVTDGLFSTSAQVVVNVINISDNLPLIFPVEKTITVDLDSVNNEISLNGGTGGPLAVLSEDNAALVSGYANISVFRNGILETFPNQYGTCECTNSACLDVFTLCGTSFSLQQDLFSGVRMASSAGPTLVSGLNFQVYSFNGRNDLSNNWLEISSSIKTQFLQRTDDFTVSFWIRVTSGTSSAYILTFELGTNRYFSLYEASSTTLNLFYFRDNIRGVVNDDGRDTQVALTFFYDPAAFPIGLRDNQWHFFALTIDFPLAVINVDGYEHHPVRGNYRNEFQSRVDLQLLTDGTYYNMPAPLLNKTQAQIDGISGKIGGSARSTRFTLDGEIRQITLTNTFDASTVSCVASCNNRISIGPNAMLSSESTISTLYNPVTRTLFFSGVANATHYTKFLQSLIYNSNGFLLPEEEGEIRVITIRIRNEADFSNTVQISIVGQSNQHDPILDTNGDRADGVDFEVNFHEDYTQQVSIISSQAFISDYDIATTVAWITATIVNPQLHINYEFLSLVNNVPTILAVSGANTYSINFTAVDPFHATANVFITALLSVRYNNYADEPVGVNRLIRFTISDGLRTGSASTTVRIHTNDDPPSLHYNGYNVVSQAIIVQYTESSAPIHLAPNLSLSDPDSPSIVGAHTRIEQVFDEGNESIAFDLSLLPSGVFCIPSLCNGTDIRITSAGTQHEYQALLRTLRYVNLKQLDDHPNLRDRKVYITISDGVSSSDQTFHILINFITANPSAILELAAPNQNLTTSFTVGQSEPIECYSLIRVVDPSIQTFDSVIVSIHDNLPEGVTERDEITLTMPILGDISVEINTVLKKITFSRVASIDQYIAAIRQIRYFNPEDEPYPINRFVDFLVIPGGGAPNDEAHCNITIINSNANPPTCNSNQVYDEVPENSPPNTFITQLMVANNEGSNTNISYSMVSGDYTLFRVAPSGEILSLGRLNREIIDEYQLQIDACVNATSQLCCRFNVSIVVIDVNDNAPTFELPLYRLSVDENWTGDIANFTIQDNDIGTNAEVASIEIDDESYFPRADCMGRFSVQRQSLLSNIYVLSTGFPFVDFEQTDVCNFSLIVTDAGVPSLIGSTKIQVMIRNLDDNPPVFSTDSYGFNVEEDNSVPLVIGRVNAFDVDSTVITYSLVGTTEFEIDPTHGNVSILFSANRDIAAQYQFTVIAEDPANHSTGASVIVNITAVNKYPPVLDLNVTAFDSKNVEIPVVFVEEGESVVIATDPFIQDPDEVVLTITSIHVEVANSGSLGNEMLSVVEGPLINTYSTLSSTPGVLILEPTMPTDILAVYSLLQNVQYQNTEDEVSACRDDLYPCKFGPTSRTLLFFVFDGSFFSNHSEVYVTFQAVNDRPYVDLDNAALGIGFETEFRQGAGPVRITSIDGFTLSDVDDENLESLNCTLINPLNDLSEFIFINDTNLPNGLILSTNGPTQSLQITGTSSISNYKTALSLISYNSISVSPITVPPRLITVSVYDGDIASDPAVAAVLFQIEGERPSGTLSDQPTAATTGLTTLSEEAPGVSTNALVIIVLAIIVFVAVIVILGLVGTVVMVYKRKSIPQQTVHTTIRNQATGHETAEHANIFAHRNPSYGRHQDVNAEPHTYESLSLYEIPIEPAQVNTNPVATNERIMDSIPYYVNDLDEGTGGTYVSVLDSTGDTYVTIEDEI